MYSKVQFFKKLLIIGMLHVFSMVFGVKELISKLKMTLMFMYCTVLYNIFPYIVQYSTVFHKTVKNRHAICLFHGFWGQGTYFLTWNEAYIHVLHSTVQLCTILTVKYISFTNFNYRHVLCHFQSVWEQKYHFKLNIYHVCS